MPNRTSGVTSVMIRTVLRLLVVTLLGVALSPPLASTAQAGRFPDRLDLPNGFMPEGITIGRHATAYLGSRADGDIIAVSLCTGKHRLISEGLGPDFPSIASRPTNMVTSSWPAGPRARGG